MRRRNHVQSAKESLQGGVNIVFHISAILLRMEEEQYRDTGALRKAWLVQIANSAYSGDRGNKRRNDQ